MSHASRRPRWGLLGAGRIAHDFAAALHEAGAEVVACAARELQRAEGLLQSIGISGATAYGSYQELAADSRVDIVYIASLHVAHKEHILLCLRAGKHVLCEKPLAMNEADARDVMDEARGRGLVCLEAMWTRYFPLVRAVRDRIARGDIGQVLSVSADVGFVRADDGRGWQRELGGGALLWNGVYALQWASLAFGGSAAVAPTEVLAVVDNTEDGVDKHGAASLRWPGGGIAALAWSHVAQMSNEVRISGSQGCVTVRSMAHCPTRIEVVCGASRTVQQVEELREDLPSGRADLIFPNSQGLRFQVDGVEELLQPLLREEGESGPSLVAVAEAVAKAPFPPSETLLVARIADAIRSQGGIRYPSEEAPREKLYVCDAHMHCWDQHEKVTTFNNHILGDCGTYLPADYLADLRAPGLDIELCSVVHVEAFPADEVEETRWINSLKAKDFPVAAIVANANISLQKENEKSRSTQKEGMEALENVLKSHLTTSGLVRGIRWVLNYEPNWPQVHRGDYFTDPHFRAGFEKLREHGLSYDLQCNPHQLGGAALFFKDYPDVPVVLNHIGSLRLEDWQSMDAAQMRKAKKVWQNGMKALAGLGHVYCKLSMLAYTLPGWWTSARGKKAAKELILEVLSIFGTDRCMFASNFPAEPEGIGRVELFRNFRDMVVDLPAEAQDALFRRNAERFYRIGSPGDARGA